MNSRNELVLAGWQAKTVRMPKCPLFGPLDGLQPHFWCNNRIIRATGPALQEVLMSGRTTNPADADRLLTPAEVAAMFRVDPKTVTRWAKAGKLSSIRTLGGHRRYKASEVEALLHGLDLAAVPPHS